MTWRVQYMRTITFTLILTVVFSFAGCTIGQNESIQETPTPPPELLDLPADAQIQCFNDSNLDRGGSYIWEFPGIEPSDSNSAYQGDTGERIGTLPSCTWVTITNYSWSETDQEFWVLVDADGVKGWIAFDLVNLVP